MSRAKKTTVVLARMVDHLRLFVKTQDIGKLAEYEKLYYQWRQRRGYSSDIRPGHEARPRNWVLDQMQPYTPVYVLALVRNGKMSLEKAKSIITLGLEGR